MFDLLFGQVFGIVGFEWLAIVAHALGAVTAHLLVFGSSDLSIFCVELVIQCSLLDYFPGILDQ